jgi:hypothetical protein
MLAVGGNKEATEPSEMPPAGVTSEQTAMEFYAANDEFVQNDEITFADKDVEPTDYGTFGKTDASVTPLRWGRIVTSITKTVTIEVQPGDTVAIGTVEKTIIGQLKIRAIAETGDTVTLSKPFTDISKRLILFKRVARNRDRYWFNWVPVASTLIKGGTAEPNNLISLTKVELFLPSGQTITITDPNAYWLRYRWLRIMTNARDDAPELTPGTMVRLRATLVSASPDTDLVALRYGFSLFHARRLRMSIVNEVDNGDGTFTREYEATWPVHFHRGYFHAGVDAITKGTLFDDQAPYSASWWGVPYRVL